MPGKFDINPATGKQYGVNPATGVQDDNYWANVVEPKLKGTTSGSSGGGTFDISSYLASAKQQQQEMINKQNAEQEALFKTFEEKQAAQPGLTSIYDKLIAEQGLPEKQQAASAVRGEIFKVKDLLDQLDADVTARTSGTLTTESQRRRQIAAEREPLSANLGRLATGLEPLAQDIQASMGNVNTRLTLSQQDRERELDPIKLRISAVSDRFAREITGYNQQKQDELTVLLDKWKEQQNLEQREWERVQTLAAEERQWQRTKEQMEMEQQNAIKLKLTSSGGGSGVLSGNPYLIGIGTGQTSSVGTTSGRSFMDLLNLDLNLNKPASPKIGGFSSASLRMVS